MTLVMGAHLGDAVGIAGDTRVSFGNGEFRDDALKVYQFPPFFIAGISGDAWSAVVLINEFYLHAFVGVSRQDGFRRAVDPDYVRKTLLELYADTADCHHHPFGIVYAADDTLLTLKPGESRQHTMDVAVIQSASFHQSAETLARTEGVPGRRLLLSISFPEGKTATAGPGQVLLAGTGAKFEPSLMARPVAIHGAQLAMGDRFAAMTGDMQPLAEIANDASFNGFSVGIALGWSDLSLTLHGYHHWPNGSRPEDCEWEPADPSADGFPHMIPFSVGFDQGEINAAWVYRGDDDPARCAKTKLESYLSPDFIARYRPDGRFRLML